MARKHSSRNKWFSKQSLIAFIDDIPEEQEEAIERSAEEYAQLENLLQIKEEAAALLNEKVQALNQERVELLKTEREQKELIVTYQQQLSQSTQGETASSTKLRQENVRLETQKQDLVRQLTEREADLEAYKAKKKAMDAQVQKLQVAHEQMLQTNDRRMSTWFASVEREQRIFVVNAKKEKQQLEEAYSYSIGQLCQFQVAYDLVVKELERAEKSLLEQEQVIETLKETTEELSFNETDKNVVIKRLQLEKEDLEEQLEVVTEQLVHVRNEKETLHAKQKQLQTAHLTEVEQLQVLKQKERQHEEMSKNYRQLEKENQVIKKSYEDLLRNHHELKEAFETTEIALEEKEAYLHELKKTIQENEAMDQEFEQLNTLCLHLKKENTLWVETRKEFEQSMNQKLEEFQMALEEKDAQNNELTEEIEELETLIEEKDALNSALFDAHEEISRLQEQLRETAHKSEDPADVVQQLKQTRRELEQLREQPKQTEESEELVFAKRQINELVEKNEALKKEVIQSQQEIGEVLISAKKQANRTIEDAQIEARHMISSAELELENISNRAKKIYIEASESKENVLGIYEELLGKIDQLSKGALLKERLKDIDVE